MSSVPDLNLAPPTLGTRLQAAREAAGFSVAEIASRVGVGTNSVQAWESDERTPRANRLLLLSGMLDITVTWLLEGQAPTMREVRTDVDRILRQLHTLTAMVETLRNRCERIVDGTASAGALGESKT
jgi:transcriptional regulator with XRE-family HTH domain